MGKWEAVSVLAGHSPFAMPGERSQVPVCSIYPNMKLYTGSLRVYFFQSSIGKNSRLNQYRTSLTSIFILIYLHQTFSVTKKHCCSNYFSVCTYFHNILTVIYMKNEHSYLLWPFYWSNRNIKINTMLLLTVIAKIILMKST